jgi:uncharacterized RDD family membrane protein YckC
LELPNNQYILVISGKPEGPFTVAQLKGHGLKSGDFVKTPEMVDYKEAHEIEELREIFHFRKQTVIPQYFGSFDQRLLASVLDGLFVSGFYIIIAFTAILFIYDSQTRLAIGLSLLIIIPVTNLVYHIKMESSARQATYGKQILKIKVCDMEGKRISPGKAVGRNFGKILSSISIIGYLLLFFDKQQRCLHDMIAGTLVVKDRLI